MSNENDHGILIFDSHLDISMNAMEWNREQRWSVGQIRRSEEGMTDKPDRGKSDPKTRNVTLNIINRNFVRFLQNYF